MSILSKLFGKNAMPSHQKAEGEVIFYKDVNIYQDDHQVLDSVNLTGTKGEMIYVIGQVGTGKTSLIHSLYGELEISNGEAYVLDTNLRNVKAHRLPRLRKQIGVVFQDFHLMNDRTVRQNLDFVLRATGWKHKTERQQRIHEVLTQVGLPGVAEKRPFELSGGEQQRICIARAILNKPRLILADEPTGHLDDNNGRTIMQLLDSIRQTEQATVVITTHNMQWLHELPGTIYVCENGKLKKLD